MDFHSALALPLPWKVSPGFSGHAAWIWKVNGQLLHLLKSSLRWVSLSSATEEDFSLNP